jgi:hypothetical protein
MASFMAMKYLEEIRNQKMASAIWKWNDVA